MLLAGADCRGAAWTLYLLAPDAMAERWTGTRVKPSEAEAISGVKDIRLLPELDRDLNALATSGNYNRLMLDLYRFGPRSRIVRRIFLCASAESIPLPAHRKRGAFPARAAADQAALRNRSASPS